MGFIDDNARLGAALRLIRAATGEEYGDGDMVTGYGIGYAPGNSGYHSDVWVTGNWNDTTRYDSQTQTRTTVSTIPSRLAAALGRIDVNTEWLDQNSECSGCQHLIQTEPDSHMWQPQYSYLNDCEILCKDCIAVDPAEVLAEYVNDKGKAVTFLSAGELESLGWHEAMPTAPDGTNGWHPGQTDTPADTLAAWRRDPNSELPDGGPRDWVFLITDVSQFYMSWRLFARDDCDHLAQTWSNECQDCGATLEPIGADDE